MKTLCKIIALLGLAGVAYAGPSGPPAGNYLLNVSTSVSTPAFKVSSGTVSTQLKLNYGTKGNLIWLDSNGIVTTTTTIPAGGDVVKASTQTLTGFNTFTGSTTHKSQVVIQTTNSGSGQGSGGALFINATNESGMPVQIYSSSANAQAFLSLINSNTNYANNYLYVNGASSATGKADAYLTDPNPNIQFVETGVVSPAGQYEFMVVADTFQLRAMNSGGSAYKPRVGMTHPGSLCFYETNDNGHFVCFSASNTIASNVNWTLPAADSSGCFQSDGAGHVSIMPCSANGIVSPGTFTWTNNGFGINVGTMTAGSSTDTTLGNNPWVTINTSGTAEALTITNYGQPSNGVQNQMGTVTIIDPLGSKPSASLVIVDSVTDTQTGSGEFEIWSDNPLHNDPIIWIHRTSSNSSPEMRWDSPSPNMEMINTSTDTAHGLGKWEPFAEASGGVDLQINNRAWSNGTFETLASYHPLSKKDSPPGLYFRPQNVTDDGGVLTSSDTSAVVFNTLNNHNVGLTGPSNSTASYYFGLPDTTGGVGDIIYNSGNRGNNFAVRQWKWITAGSLGQVLTMTASTPTWSTPTGTPSGASYTYQYKNTSSGLTGGSLSEDSTNGGIIVTTTGGIHLADISGSHYVGFRASDTLAGSTLWVLPDQDGSSGDLLGTTGNVGGVHSLQWITPTGTPGGGTNSLQYRTSGSAFSGAPKLFRDSATEGLQLETTGQIEFSEAANDHYVGFRAQDSGMSGSTIWQLPLVDGTANQVLQTGGSPNHILTWATMTGGSGGSILAVTTGTTSGFTGPAASSPTTVLNFDKTYFTVNLEGGATAFTTITPLFSTTNTWTASQTINSSATVNGSVFISSALPTGVLTTGPLILQNANTGSGDFYTPINFLSGSVGNAMYQFGIHTGLAPVGFLWANNGTPMMRLDSALSASLPVQTDADLGLVSSAIDLSGVQATGTMAAGRFPALTGDVTTTAGSVGTTAAGTQANITNLSHAITATSSVTVTGANLTTNFLVVNSSVSVSSNTILGAATYYTNGVIAGASMNANELSGTLQTAQEPAHTGDVTNSAGSLAMTAAGTQANITNLTHSITATSSLTVTGATLISTLTITGPTYNKDYNTITATNYVITSTDSLVLCNAVSNPVTLTLPSASASNGQILTIQKNDVSASSCTIKPSGTDLIVSTGVWYLFAQSQEIVIQSTGGTNLWAKAGPMETPETYIGGTIAANVAETVATSSNIYCSWYGVSKPSRVTGMRFSASTANGNMDVAIIDQGGTRLASSGSTAIPGTGTQTVNFTAATNILPGTYGLCVQISNITGALRGLGNVLNGPFLNTATSMGIPATLTVPGTATAIGMTLEGIVTGGGP